MSGDVAITPVFSSPGVHAWGRKASQKYLFFREALQFRDDNVGQR